MPPTRIHPLLPPSPRNAAKAPAPASRHVPAPSAVSPRRISSSSDLDDWPGVVSTDRPTRWRLSGWRPLSQPPLHRAIYQPQSIPATATALFAPFPDSHALLSIIPPTKVLPAQALAAYRSPDRYFGHSITHPRLPLPAQA
ncbi:hypothetical protein CTheo_4065 [Ceratobasidium theobromae]|uniref:Uncharacterized protein n=1 Tax=Ceratobasidium theobromae TaxID=1582974 RepID=A0A5N5QLD1_9AGAM|nr:hypothetical protein CTheo_4065 [Ceratobasidium theobromae]